MSGACAPAPRLAMMLPTAHASPAAITRRKPTNVPLSPAPSLCAARSATPATAIACADEVVPLQPVAVEHHGEPDREEHLQLDDERRESGGHAELHPEEEQAELQDADRGPVADDVAPGHRRSAG